MNRYAIENLFGIEGLNIAWYGLIIACGMVLGFALAIYRCRKTGINKEHIYNLALWLIPVCIICARAYYVILEWDNYKNDLLSVFEINRGGLAIYGGVGQDMHGGIDHLVFAAFVNAVKTGAHAPIDVYDAATYMCITALSEESVAKGGAPVAFPDFTGGRWTERSDIADNEYTLDKLNNGRDIYFAD